MAAEAGPSDAAADDEGEEEQEFEELQEPPFADPELRPMLLCDLLGRAAEEEVAAIAHNSEHPLTRHGPATANYPLPAMSLPPTHITLDAHQLPVLRPGVCFLPSVQPSLTCRSQACQTTQPQSCQATCTAASSASLAAACGTATTPRPSQQP